MSDKSGIEWTESTWNPVTGCSKVSQGCKHCYAEREWPRLAAPRAKPNIYTGRAFTDVKCHPEKLDIPLRWTKTRRIFVNSMSDLFHESVPDEFIDKVFAVMAMAPQHTFQCLTKRADRMLACLTDEALSVRNGTLCSGIQERIAKAMYDLNQNAPDVAWPLPNVWLGVSCEDQATADERIPLLLQTPASVRWISAEPLLGPVDLSAEYLAIRCGGEYPFKNLPNEHRTKLVHMLDWVVVGGESGPKARPMNPNWVRSLRDQCQTAGVSFFVKQLSGERGRPIKDITAFPTDLQIREYPR